MIVIKKDGREVPFSKSNIQNSVQSVFKSIGVEMPWFILPELWNLFSEGPEKITSKEIEDIIISKLNGYAPAAAEAYKAERKRRIEYRYKHDNESLYTRVAEEIKYMSPDWKKTLTQEILFEDYMDNHLLSSKVKNWCKDGMIAVNCKEGIIFPGIVHNLKTDMYEIYKQVSELTSLTNNTSMYSDTILWLRGFAKQVTGTITIDLDGIEEFFKFDNILPKNTSWVFRIFNSVFKKCNTKVETIIKKSFIKNLLASLEDYGKGKFEIIVYSTSPAYVMEAVFEYLESHLPTMRFIFVYASNINYSLKTLLNKGTNSNIIYIDESKDYSMSYKGIKNGATLPSLHFNFLYMARSTETIEEFYSLLGNMVKETYKMYLPVYDRISEDIVNNDCVWSPYIDLILPNGYSFDTLTQILKLPISYSGLYEALKHFNLVNESEEDLEVLKIHIQRIYSIFETGYEEIPVVLVDTPPLTKMDFVTINKNKFYTYDLTDLFFLPDEVAENIPTEACYKYYSDMSGYGIYTVPITNDMIDEVDYNKLLEDFNYFHLVEY